MTAERILWAYFLASIVAMVVVGSVAVSKLRSARCGERSSYPLKIALGYGIKSHLSSIVSFLNYRIDIFLVNYLLGPAMTGIYSVAVQIVEKLWLLSQAVSTVLFPRLSASSRNGETVTAITSLVTRLTMIVTLVAGIGLALIGYYLISIVFGASFLDAYVLLLVLLPGAVAGSGVRLLSSEIAARGRPEINLYMGIFVVVLNAVLNVLLIPPMGAIGAAVATTIAYGMNLVVRLVVFRRITGARIADAILPKMADARLVRANVASYFHRIGAKR
jgi:O-antigen/teichoic acid export membrane protein